GAQPVCAYQRQRGRQRRGVEADLCILPERHAKCIAGSRADRYMIVGLGLELEVDVEFGLAGTGEDLGWLGVDHQIALNRIPIHVPAATSAGSGASVELIARVSVPGTFAPARRSVTASRRLAMSIG